VSRLYPIFTMHGQCMAFVSAHPSITVNVPGRAYSLDLRSRVAVLKNNGLSNAAIGRRLGMHRSTVGRWIKNSVELEPGIVAPFEQRARLGSMPLLNREVLRAISRIVSESPRYRVEDVRAELVRLELLPSHRGKLVSSATVRRGMLKCSSSHRKMRHRDAKSFGGRILAERRAFALAQVTNERMRIENLLCFDETTLYNNESETTGWGLAATKICAPKSPGMGVTLFLSLGVTVDASGKAGSWVHYRAYPPSNAGDATDAIFPDWEVNRRQLCPSFAGALREGRVRAVPKASLVEFLRNHNVSCRVVTDQAIKDASPLAARLFVRSDGKSGPLTKVGLAAVALHMCEDGLVGLAVAGGVTVLGGGRKQRVRGSTETVQRYLQALSDDAQDPTNEATFLPSLGERSLILDNASYHGALRSTEKKSWLHRLAHERYGLRTVVWTPPVSPEFNPTERANAWLKTFIRKRAPADRPFSDAELLLAIDEAMRVLRASDFCVNWFLGCGYLFDPNGTSWAPRDRLPSARERLLADVTARFLEPGGCTFRDAVLIHNDILIERGEEPLLDVRALRCVEDVVPPGPVPVG
jgi:transposase